MRVFILVLGLAGCGDGDVADSEPLTGGETCTALVSGTWYGAGDAFGMPAGSTEMTVELTMDSDSCSFSLTGWSMEMGPLADEGALDGDQVQLAGPTSYFDSCTGTAADDRSVSGTCSDDGDAFELFMDAV